MQEFIDTYPMITQAIPWLGGAIGGFFIFVIRNRRPLLTYNVSHQRIGMTADDDIHGRVEVRYRDRVVHNLYLSVMEIKNRSIKDIENLNIKTYRGSNEISMLTEEAHIHGTLESCGLTPEYLGRITSDAEWEREINEAETAEVPENARRLGSDFGFRHGQRHYLIPLLNRGQTAKITYLITAAPNATPTIYMTCQTKGVRVKEKPLPRAITYLWDVPVAQAALVGICVGAVISGVVIWQIDTYWIGALACFIVGVFANVPGALSIKAYDWVRGKMMG